ncbi:probable acyl-CoA dehydrogenase short-branched chain precursor [Ustilago bromivora]|uniref:Short/branched chain specific acyl-CoA dehydrogenase, mitochondrial n=1 Tax=Ustilago bromivora TaxID=307758 RepID=A0A1K0GDZ9_9BASI|nr:probable acyl-CoA dehydrogenase short-branched chain precursor [Ustilago bromivora]SYW82490.1 probable acyl-CoA dehydrogenase short-branched chain precursor [Ustilago bromivora]
MSLRSSSSRILARATTATTTPRAPAALATARCLSTISASTISASTGSKTCNSIAHKPSAQHLVSAIRTFSTSSPTNAEFESPFGVNSLAKFTEEEEMLREAVQRFAQDNVAPKVEAMDEAEKMDPEIIKGLFEQGLMGIETSADHGGAGCSFTAAIIVIEELAKVDPSVSVLCDVHNTLVNTVIRKYASKHIQDKYLPALSEKTLGSFCLSEPASGSDAFAMKTSCKKSADGKSWTINGSKMWITNSAEAEFFIVFAQSDPSQGYKGINAFAVEKSMGVEIAKKEKKLGIKASSTCTLNLDDIIVPAENLIGEEGKGYKIAIEILNEGRVGIAAQMIGLAQGAVDKAIRYAADRKQFGKKITQFQGMQFQISQIMMEIQAAKALTYNAARLKEEGRPFTKEAAMAKLYASQVAQRASGSAIEWCGGVGFTRETGIEKYWRDSKIGAIYEGTSNIMLETIFKLVEREMDLK